MKKLKEKKISNRYFEARQRNFLSQWGFLHPKNVKNLLSLFCDNLTIKQFSSVLFILFIFLLPTQLGKHFFPSYSYLNGIRVDYLSPTIYMTDILVFFLFILNFKVVIEFFKNKNLLIFLCLLVVNVLMAKNQLVALYGFIKIIELLIVFFLGKLLFGKVGEKKVLMTFFLSGIFQLFLSMMQMVLKHSQQGLFYFFGERLFGLSTPGIAKATLNGVELLRPYGTFSHPNSLAGFFLLLYFFVLVYKDFDKYPIFKYLNLFVFSILIFISFSKVAILTLLFLNTIYYLFNSKIKCIPCKLARVLVPVFVSLVFLFAITDPLTVDKRLELMKNAFSIIRKSPIFGAGLGNYLIIQSKFGSIFPLFFNQPVHNIFLLFVTEAGFFISAVIFKIFLSAKLKKEGMIIVLVVIITGFFDHYWLTLQQNLLLFGLVYGAASSSFLIARLRSSS